MERKPLLFAESNAYFPHEELLQSSINFVNPLDIDTYIKQSFGLLTDSLMLTWAEVTPFSKDHLIDEHFLCYKIEGLNNKKLVQTEWIITCNFKKEGLFAKGLIQGLIQGMPIMSILILSLISRLAPASIANILMYISLIWLIITCCFYAVKMVKFFIQTILSKEIEYGNMNVIFINHEDSKIISEDIAKIFKELHKTQNIDKIVFFQWSLFFKQSTKGSTVWETIKDKFRLKSIDKPSEDYKPKIQQTVSYLLDQNLFI